MSDLDKALSQANKVMARNHANTPEAKHKQIGRHSTFFLVGGLVAVGAIVGAYAFWLNLSSAKTAAKVQGSPPSKLTAVSPALPRQANAVPTLAPPVVDHKLASAFEKMTLNAILTDPPRVRMNGKTFSIGSELIPGLILKKVENRTIIAEDGAGAVYRRTF